MTTSFRRRAAYIISVVLFFSCRGDDRVRMIPTPLEHVEIGLAETGYVLTFELPSVDWRCVRRATPGLLYSDGARSFELMIFPDERAFARETVASAQGTELRAFRVGTWPFVGVIVSYRGPPDVSMLDAFIRSFKVERI